MNAYACFCPDRVFRPQCNTSSSLSSSSNTNGGSVLIHSSKTSNNQGDISIQDECPCRNGGICHTNPSSGKICQCPKSFTGQFCETSICKFINKKKRNEC